MPGIEIDLQNNNDTDSALDDLVYFESHATVSGGFPSLHFITNAFTDNVASRALLYEEGTNLDEDYSAYAWL